MENGIEIGCNLCNEMVFNLFIGILFIIIIRSVSYIELVFIPDLIDTIRYLRKKNGKI